jgi:predicted ArsR family transcriptional regulator
VGQAQNLKNFEFSPEIKDLISTVKNETQWKIMEFLIQNDNELSYTKIREKLQISDKQKFKFTYHLKELIKGGWLINKILETETKGREKSFYSISDIGLKMLEGSLKVNQLEEYSTNVWMQLLNKINEQTADFSKQFSLESDQPKLDDLKRWRGLYPMNNDASSKPILFYQDLIKETSRQRTFSVKTGGR